MIHILGIPRQNLMKNNLKYFRCYFLFFLLFHLTYTSSQINIDSLKKVAEGDCVELERINSLLCLSKYETPIQALIYAERARELSHVNKYYEKEGLALEYISLCNRRMGNYTSAIKASLDALQIYDRIGAIDKKASLQLQIGSHLSNEGNYKLSKTYIESSLSSFQIRKDTLNMMYALINLGETYRRLFAYDSAKICFKYCIELNRSAKNRLVEGYALGNIGLTYLSEDSTLLAENNLLKSINILSNLSDVYSLACYKSKLAQFYLSKGMDEKGESMLLECLKISKRENLKEQIRDISLDLSQFYEVQGDYSLALNYRKNYEFYNDSIKNLENVRNIEQLRSQYYLKKKEDDILFLEQENKNKNIQILLSLFGVTLTILLSAFLYYALHSRKVAYVKLLDQKKIIEKKKEEIELLYRELNHRIKNNLQMIASIFSLQAGRYCTRETSESLAIAKLRVESLTLIHQKLVPSSSNVYLLLNDYITDLAENLIFSLGIDVDLQLKLDKVRLHVDDAIPLGIVLNELLTNSLKYAVPITAKARLMISLLKKHDGFMIIIRDNGPGLIEKVKASKSRSIGLKLVKSLLKQIKGEIIQTNDNGCVWSIYLKDSELKNLKL